MSIDLGTESVTLSVTERTWRIEMFTEYGEDPILRSHREKLWLRPDGRSLKATGRFRRSSGN
jgi:hypothetical protein